MSDAEPQGASRPPSLKDAPFLRDPAVRAVFAAIERDGDSVRVVGGAVRDAFLGRAIREVDFATTAVPAIVEKRARAAGIKTVPTGIEHGTVTLIVDGRPFEMTTLREDIETDGRRAVVRFGRDWEADARRRDFTMNALSVGADGTVHDPVGGYPDVVARRVRFIGDPDQRIAEDRLRLLRFFRFHAEIGEGEPDGAGLEAAIRGRSGLAALPAERIAHEMRRLIAAPGAAETARCMQEASVLQIVLGGIGYVAQLRRVIAFEAGAGLAPGVPRRLAALSARIVEDVDRVATRLRLSNAERAAMLAGVSAAPRLIGPPTGSKAREQLYRLGREAFADGLAQAAAIGVGDPTPWAKTLAATKGWIPPRFPLTGGDLTAAGLAKGPAIGAFLKELEEWWITEGFSPDRAALLNRLQQMAAGQQ